jgi:hypothetical protein
MSRAFLTIKMWSTKPKQYNLDFVVSLFYWHIILKHVHPFWKIIHYTVVGMN